MEFLLIWRAIWKWKWLAILMFLAFFVPVLLVTHLVKPTYRATAKVLVDTSGARSSLLTVLGIGNDIAVADNSEHDNEIAEATLRPVIDELIKTLNLRDRHGKPCNADNMTGFSLLSKFRPQPMISVNQYEDSDLIQIKAQSANPEEAAKMANTLANIFASNTAERVRLECVGIRKFIDKELADVEERYRSALKQSQSFHETSGVIDVTGEIQNTLTLQSSLSTLDVGLAKIAAEYTKDHPNYQDQQQQIEETRKLIEKELKTMPARQAEFTELSATSDAITSSYQSLLQYRIKMGMAEQLITSNMRLLEPAVVPIKPSFPNKPLMYSLGIIIGCFWSLGVVLLVEYIATARREESKLAPKTD